MNLRLSDRAPVAFMLSASIASTIGGLPFDSLRVMLRSMADSFALDPKAVGLMGSICFAGYLLGTLAAPLWIIRMNWHAHPVGPAEQGARLRLRQGVELSVTAAVLFALPPLVIAVWRYHGAALALAAMVALLGLSAVWVPALAYQFWRPGAGRRAPGRRPPASQVQASGAPWERLKSERLGAVVRPAHRQGGTSGRCCSSSLRVHGNDDGVWVFPCAAVVPGRWPSPAVGDKLRARQHRMRRGRRARPQEGP